jgi:hypothetical protein
MLVRDHFRFNPRFGHLRFVGPGERRAARVRRSATSSWMRARIERSWNSDNARHLRG